MRSGATDASAIAASPLAEITAEIDAGRFADADRRIGEVLAHDSSDRAALDFQRERMRRIRIDFPLDEAAVKARLRESIPDLRDEEFARWDAQGKLEHYVIDGQTRWFKGAARNLFYLSEEARARRQTKAKPDPDMPLYAPNAHHRAVIAAARASGETSVAPIRVRVTQSMSVHPGAVPAGETVRAWLPFPRAIPGRQEDVRLLSSNPSGARIAPESALQRTAYLERPAESGMPTSFSVSYEVTLYARYFAVDPDKVKPATVTPALREYLGERPPHIVFTDALREFSHRIVGDEKNPYRIAQKLFDAVDGKIWAVAREYSTLSNISDYTLHSEHGDCGEQTLLLMTLLRLNGIPARWQSGWEISPGSYDDMHDWGQLWLEPYGWVPMDVTHGRLHDPDPAVDWFYLGGLDAYRIAFNDDFSRDFVPPKQYFRSETVDLQRGEAEWKGGNLYFDQWDYHFDWQLLKDQAPRKRHPHPEAAPQVSVAR